MPDPRPHHPPRAGTARRRLRRRVVLAGAALLAAVLLLELGLRAWAHSTGRVRGLDWDPLLGWRMLPDLEKVGAGWSTNGPARTNSHGWRDAERSFAKPPGTRRIVALGDSFTFGQHVDVEARFGERLAARFAERFAGGLAGGLDCEAINLGMCAIGTDQELLAFERDGVRYAPDLVLLLVFLANDLDDIRKERLAGWSKPWFRLDDGELELVPPVLHATTWLRTRSYLFEGLMQALERGLPGERVADAWRDRDPLPLFAALIERLHERVEAAGARLVVAFAHPLVDGPDAERLVFADRAIAAARRDGVEVVDTFAAFAAAGRTRAELYHEDGHWTAAGHAVAAAAIGDAIEASGLLGALPDLAGARWRELPTGARASLRGLCALDRQIAWASGSDGTVLRTLDGGATWQRRDVPGGETTDFRDVHAFDADTAIVLGVGEPGLLFRTTDGGASWARVHEDRRSGVFLDGLAFADAHNGFVFGDPIDGAFAWLVTHDSGATWRDASALPPPAAGEAGFAASGTNLCARGDAVWVATGGGAARCLRSSDRGASFTAARLPLAQGSASQGAFSIAFRDERHGVVVGGDYREPDASAGTAAWSDDGGASWHPADALGYRSCVAWLGDGSDRLVAVGERGASWSPDRGATWRALPGPGFHAVAVGADGSVWAAGSDGRVARLEQP